MSNSLGAKADAFRNMHHVPPILVLPNAWDAASARVFAAAGARAIATTSAGVAAALGYSDGQKVPRDLMLEAIARIAGIVDVPVTADIEAGYGPASSDVAQTIRGVIAAGAVGFNLEDATGDPANPLFDIETQVARVQAAREACARAGVPAVVNARTDVFLLQTGEPAGRFSDAVRRANAYLEAGADCLFVPGVADLATLTQLTREISGPLNVLAGAGTPRVSELQRIGVARVSVGSGILRATLALAKSATCELLEQGTYSAFTDHAISYRELNQIMESR
jgi:2-methylisocitrate lyase-like PEP mutase family enzyme